MYKPPENTNRVKSMKSRFENIEKPHETKEKTVALKNGTRDNVIIPRSYLGVPENDAKPLNLQRQLSDPSKRNIKRTPAFRLDKSVDKVAAFQRGSVINKSQEFKHVLKPISAVKTQNCDIISDISANSNAKIIKPFLTKENKPVLYKSKSSIDFKLIRSKFDSDNSDDNVRQLNQRTEETKVRNISALYTEPIPKSLRVKTCDNPITKPVYSNLKNLCADSRNGDEEVLDIHSSSTLKLTDKTKSNKTVNNSPINISTDKFLSESPNSEINSIERRKISTDSNSDSISAMRKLDTLLQLTKSNSLKKPKILKKAEGQVEFPSELSDTLKNALKRPLPSGPAPKKPPRTFEHCVKKITTEDQFGSLEKNVSFLHISKNKDCDVTTPLCLKEKPLKRSDPKYMLNKLETALRNNKLKSKRSVKTDVSTTSGEDSDDNIFLKNNFNTSVTNQNRTLPSVPDNGSRNSSLSPGNNLLAQALNFNCMTGCKCVSTPYSKLNESKSSFFIAMKNEEPLYAEPWQFEEGLKVSIDAKTRSSSSDRGSKDRRNSLYYMSSPVLCNTPRSNSSSRMNVSTKQTDVPSKNMKCRSEKAPSPESPSSSSESSASTLMEELRKSFDTSINIKQLIDVFENRSSTLDNKENNRTTTDCNGHREDISEKIEDDINLTDSNLEDTEHDFFHQADDSFDPNDNCDKDSNSESEKMTSGRKSSVDDPTVKKFRTYVRNVSVYTKAKPHWRKSTLFDCCLIVEWNADVRRIKFKYPHNVEPPHKIEDLCFPDAACGPLDKTTNAQCYSLVITDEKGERTFGYCRRVVPEGSNKCLPIAYCILSKHKSPRFYKKVLIELESRHGISELHRDNLLKAFYFNKFPQPGETITIKLTENVNGINKENLTCLHEEKEIENKSSLEDSIESNFVIINNKGEYESLSNKEKKLRDNNEVNESHNNDSICEESGDILLNFHHDPIYENSDLKDLHELPVEILQKILASLLLERKVILISCLLSKLSSCVEALQTIIYPFTWPHSIIPVLPKSLWEFVEAPTPIICGILSVELINNHEIEHGIVVDLDEKCILKEEGDEDKALCNAVLRVWRKTIAAAKTIPSDQEEHSFHLTDAYIRMFALILKNYRDYIVNGNFQKEAFIRSNKSKGIRRFLKWFTDTTMFLTFVDVVITNSQDFTLFDKKIELYESGHSGSALDKLLDWKILT